MDVYLDLSILALTIEIMVCLMFVEQLTTHRLKRGMKFLFIVLNIVLFFTIYLSLILSVFLFVLFNLLLFFINKKDDCLTNFLLFSFCFALLNLFVLIIGENISVLHIYLVINDLRGLLSIIIFPLFYIGLIISVKIVDSLYHLHKYKTSCFITKKDKKYFFSAYYDSGNTLKYDNVPVIFCVKKEWKFIDNESTIIEVESVNGKSKYIGYEALLSIEDSNENYFVYVVVIDKIDSFHGCEVLLNAYLR